LLFRFRHWRIARMTSTAQSGSGVSCCLAHVQQGLQRSHIRAIEQTKTVELFWQAAHGTERTCTCSKQKSLVTCFVDSADSHKALQDRGHQLVQGNHSSTSFPLTSSSVIPTTTTIATTSNSTEVFKALRFRALSDPWSDHGGERWRAVEGGVEWRDTHCRAPSRRRVQRSRCRRIAR
jgi:hypothetical protein